MAFSAQHSHSGNTAASPRSGSCGELRRSGSRCSLQQPTHSQEIVGGTHEVRGERSALAPFEASAPEIRYRLGPAEDFLDAFANALTDFIARMPRRSPVDGRAAVVCNVLCNVRRGLAKVAADDEVLR